jgi:ribosome recycling factor
MASAMQNIEALKSTHQELRTRMEKSVDDFRANLLSARTGRANVHMLDQIRVDYYGTDTPIAQMGQVSTPEPTLILVSPYDLGMVAAIEKAIRTSSIGLNPMSDGKDVVKQLNKTLEDHKTAIRSIRRDGNDQIKKAAKDKLISADDEKRASEEVQQLTDAEIKRIEELFKAKEKEVMTV